MTLLWVLIFALACVALSALNVARGAARHTALLWALTHPARPLRMRWSFSVILTDRAWDTLGVPAERRQELQQLIGEYQYGRTYLFKGHPAPAWVSRPITVRYERWGESLERWTIENSWASEGLEPTRHYEKRVQEFLPGVRGAAETVNFWGEREGPHFRFQDGRFFFLNNVSVMFDGKLYVKDGAHLLFDIPAPTLSMSHVDQLRDARRGMSWEESTDPRWRPSPLDQFATPDDPRDDGFGARYHRRQGQEWFECEDWAKGFRWDLAVNDLRPALLARVTRPRPSFWRRRVQGMVLQLRDSGVTLIATPRVVEPSVNGRTLPQKDEIVWAVLNDEGGVDRIWLHEWPGREPKSSTEESGPGP